MAQYTYSYLISYLGNGTGANDPVGDQTVSGTLDDGEADGVFDFGDAVVGANLNQNVSNGVFIGTTVIDGQEWPVFYHASVNESIVYATYQIPIAAHPATLTVNSSDTFDAPCFLEGTMIATPEGQTPVEALCIGDTILTADGASVPVRWVGRRTVSTTFGAAGRSMPVCIEAGALGQDVPLRDLRVTADHALLIDGLLINAGALVNDTTIRVMQPAQLGRGFAVYHIETEAHAVILAEGAAAETYIDYVGRQAFENYGEYLALYGADRAIAELAQPRVTAARHVPAALRARLARDLAA